MTLPFCCWELNCNFVLSGCLGDRHAARAVGANWQHLSDAFLWPIFCLTWSLPQRTATDRERLAATLQCRDATPSWTQLSELATYNWLQHSLPRLSIHPKSVNLGKVWLTKAQRKWVKSFCEVSNVSEKYLMKVKSTWWNWKVPGEVHGEIERYLVR